MTAAIRAILFVLVGIEARGGPSPTYADHTLRLPRRRGPARQTENGLLTKEKRAIVKMPYGSRVKQFVDELVGQFRRRALLRNWGRRAVEILGLVRSGRKERVPAKPDAGTLLYLVSLGLVATAVVVVFFGLGFLLLAHPEDEALSAAGLDNRSAEAQASRSSGSLAQSSQAHEQTPPAPTRRTAPRCFARCLCQLGGAEHEPGGLQPRTAGVGAERGDSHTQRLARGHSYEKNRDRAAPPHRHAKALGFDTPS